MSKPLLFSLELNPLQSGLVQQLSAETGQFSTRLFPDGESYLRVLSDVNDRHCIILANLAYPNDKFLPLIFLAETLRDLGAKSVGLVAPYLSYMRQDIRFLSGEAISSKIFAKQLSQHVDWMVTVDPHLHRYHALDEIYTIPTVVVQAAPLLAQWLGSQKNIVLIGPDSESRQWVEKIAEISGHPFIIGEKQRKGDRDVKVILANLRDYKNYTAIIIDDVISSGQTLLSCIDVLQEQNIKNISCAAIHGIFADGSDKLLLAKGVLQLVTCNSIPHTSNVIDLCEVLLEPIKKFLNVA